MRLSDIQHEGGTVLEESSARERSVHGHYLTFGACHLLHSNPLSAGKS